MNTKTKNKIREEFGKKFSIHQGRKWILTSEESKEIEDYLIQKIEQREKEVIEKIRKMKYEGQNVYLNEAVDDIINSLESTE